MRQLDLAIRLQPDFGLAYIYRGSALALMPGREAEALAAFQRGLQLLPGSALGHANCGKLLARLPGRRAEGIAELREAIRLDPGLADAHAALGEALAKEAGGAAEALAQLEIARNLQPDSAEAQNNLGLLLYRSGRLPEAVAAYAEALRLRPDYGPGHFNLGVALLDSGRPEQAAAELGQALGAPEHRAEAHLYLGDALAALKRTDEAQVQYAQAAQLLEAGDGAGWLGLANSLVRLGQLAPAAAAFTAAAKAEPANPEPLFGLGNALAAEEQYPAAAAAYRRALALAPGLIEARHNLGNVAAPERPGRRGGGRIPRGPAGAPGRSGPGGEPAERARGAAQRRAAPLTELRRQQLRGERAQGGIGKGDPEVLARREQIGEGPAREVPQAVFVHPLQAALQFPPGGVEAAADRERDDQADLVVGGEALGGRSEGGEPLHGDFHSGRVGALALDPDQFRQGGKRGVQGAQRGQQVGRRLRPPHLHFEGGAADENLAGILGIGDLEEPDALVLKGGIGRQRVGNRPQPGGQRRAAQQRVGERTRRPGGAGRQAEREVDVRDDERVPGDKDDVGDVAPQDQGVRRLGRGRREDLGRGLQAGPILPVERAHAAEAARVDQGSRGVGRAEDHHRFGPGAQAQPMGQIAIRQGLEIGGGEGSTRAAPGRGR